MPVQIYFRQLIFDTGKLLRKEMRTKYLKTNLMWSTAACD